jgi:tetratricopeptide (TPR) repeat protein
MGRQDACPTITPAAQCFSRGPIILLGIAVFFPLVGLAQSPTSTNAIPPPFILTVEGTNVWVQRQFSNAWESAYPQQVLRVKDRGRTGANSRTSVRLSDLSVLRIGWHSEFEIQPLPEPEVEAEFSLRHGLMRLLNRDRPGKHRFVTPTATAATRGTEFVLKVDEGAGRTTLTVFEGEAEMRNALGSVQLASGEQAVAETGQPPVKTAMLDATTIVQWCLYYPGVLDLDELELTPAEQSALEPSMTEYRDGDLLRALSAYPAGRVPASDAEKVYFAALLLAVGQVEQSESILNSLNETDPTARVRRLAGALRLMVETVTGGPRSSTLNSQPSTLLATELLAESYYRQSQFDLAAALQLARRCVEQSPNFAFGWARVAELEFSHGHIKPALHALDQSIALALNNAQAFALKGFLLAAQNDIPTAIDYFDIAIALDGGLGNAWLGRGLCRIRQGRAAAGRFDLQVAAAVEPQRSVLRSYLGKAFSNEGDFLHAEQELKIAEALDPNDPTPRLYSALLLRDLNRINESVCDLERSQELNDNRQVYRSRLLLDQDRAVRGANLAQVYRDAGLTEVSVREAARAVNADYANYSAHLFLANSYNELRDLNQINLRYETAWFSEYLLANLLAPVGAGTLSPTVSQQEYSKLFERDRFGLSSSTEYYSHGEWLQSVAQFGTSGNSSYAAEMFYHSDNGHRPNNDLEQFSARLNVKQQLTPQDSIYLRLFSSDNEYGDVNQYYDQGEANLGFRAKEKYEPSLLAGYHHEWSPGSHTLFLAGRLDHVLEWESPYRQTFFLNRGFVGNPVQSVTPLLYEQSYQTELTLYTAEVQHIWQRNSHNIVGGGRLLAGEFQTFNRQTNGFLTDGVVVSPMPFAPDQTVSSDQAGGSVYIYDHWQVFDTLLLATGLSFDWLRFPENHRFAPISDAEENRHQISPKVGLIWTPSRHTTARAAWFRGLGGVGLDQSYRLEPTQVAGFNQAYRSLIPESVVGASATATFETWALSLERKFGAGTFVGLSGEWLTSEVDRTVGVVESAAPITGPPFPFSAQGMRQQLDFQEKSLNLTLNQLLGNEWSLGARYRISRAELDDRFPDIPVGATLNGGFQRERSVAATLQQLHLAAHYNHSCGFFARAGAVWSRQDNSGYTPARPGDDFWQFNLEAGYRFAQRRAELRLGLLNLTDRDYHLNPLNLTPELPRERTLAVSVLINF